MNFILKTLAISTLAAAAFGADVTKANFQVEFPFHIGKVEMPAGAYAIRGTYNNDSVFSIFNRSTHKSAFLSLPVASDATSGNEKTVLEFACASSGCEISNIQNLRPGVKQAVPKSKKAQTTTIAVALTVPAKAAD